MKCPKCGKRNSDGARFCSRCRAALPRVEEESTGRHSAPKKSDGLLDKVQSLVPSKGRRREKESFPLKKILMPAAGILLLAVAVFLIVLSAKNCSKGKDPASTHKTSKTVTTAAVQQTVKLDRSELILGIGQSAVLEAEGVTDAAVWTSSQPTVAEVSQDGTVKALSAGETEILLTVEGTTAACKVTVQNPIVLSGFTEITGHVFGKGHRLEGVVTSLSPLTRVNVTITGENGVEVSENAVWTDGTGPLTYDLNDENQNLNKMVSFKSLTVGMKTISLTASSATETDYSLGNWKFEVYVPEFPYKSALDPDAYPCLMPEEWDEWLKAEDTKANIDPVFAGRLAAFGKAHGKQVVYISGFRTRAKQQELYDAYLNGTGNLAAKPGSGWHEFGAAVDASEWVRDVSEKEMRKYGLCKPVNGEDWHIQPVEVSNMNKENFYNSYSSKKYPEWSLNCYMPVGD